MVVDIVVHIIRFITCYVYIITHILHIIGTGRSAVASALFDSSGVISNSAFADWIFVERLIIEKINFLILVTSQAFLHLQTQTLRKVQIQVAPSGDGCNSCLKKYIAIAMPTLPIIMHIANVLDPVLYLLYLYKSEGNTEPEF